MALSFFLPFLAFVAPHAYNITLHVILSESMRPTINIGDVVGLKRDFQLSDIHVGDIIAFRQPDISVPITHRVVEIVETETNVGYRTQGDASEQRDGWIVTAEQVIGKVIFHIPRLGYVTKLVKRHYGYGLLIVLPGILLIILETRDLLKVERSPARRADWLRGTDRMPAYLYLIACSIVVSVLQGLVSRNIQQTPLTSFEATMNAQRPQTVFQRTVRNEGPFPLIICLTAEGSPVTFSQTYFRLAPGAQEPVTMWSESAENAVIVTAGFLPILPQQWIYHIFVWDSNWAPLLNLAIPGIPITLIGFALLGGFSSKPDRRERARALRRKLGY
jgi:signal peptidase